MENQENQENQEKKHKRRVRYSGTHPRNYKEKYKELNPEKKGNVLDSKFREVWMDSCDEAQQMMVYKSAYKAFSNTNMVCIWLIAITFVCAMLFKTDILSMIIVCLIWFINTFSYMLHAAKLERRG